MFVEFVSREGCRYNPSKLQPQTFNSPQTAHAINYFKFRFL